MEKELNVSCELMNLKLLGTLLIVHSIILNDRSLAFLTGWILIVFNQSGLIPETVLWTSINDIIGSLIVLGIGLYSVDPKSVYAQLTFYFGWLLYSNIYNDLDLGLIEWSAIIQTIGIKFPWKWLSNDLFWIMAGRAFQKDLYQFSDGGGGIDGSVTR